MLGSAQVGAVANACSQELFGQSPVRGPRSFPKHPIPGLHVLFCCWLLFVVVIVAVIVAFVAHTPAPPLRKA